MAIDVTSIVCPQCNSVDIRMVSETRGICNHCGAQIAIESQSENPIEKSEDLFCAKGRISNEHSEQEFIRKVWIAIAEDDAPFDVFEADLSPIEINKHQVMSESLSADVSYQVSIGYDRQEPYIDYETYYEEENYIDATGEVKKRKVEKQRPVTKYKTVTDWNSLSGKHSCESLVAVENLPDQYLDEELFSDSFGSAEESSLIALNGEEADAMQVNDCAERLADYGHNRNIRNSVTCSLPGDHNRDLHIHYDKIFDITRSLFAVEEFTVGINHNGKTYKKRAFPFGHMKIGGETVENAESLKAVIQKKRAGIPKQVWECTKSVSYVSLLLLVLSILTSLFIPYTAMVILCFIPAVAMFIYDKLNIKRETVRITKAVEAECADFSKNHKKKQRDLLNHKLVSLGLAPLEPAEEGKSDKEE